MTYLLDSNTCIGWLRQSQPKIVARIKVEGATNIRLCSVVIGELIYGAEHSGPVFSSRNLVRVSQLRQRFASLPFDDAAAENYGTVRAYLASRGVPIGSNDLMIAAIALANGFTLVTHNTAEFARVPNLNLDDWQ